MAFSWYDQNKLPGASNTPQGLRDILNPLSGGTMQNGSMGDIQTGNQSIFEERGDSGFSTNSPTYSQGYTPGAYNVDGQSLQDIFNFQQSPTTYSNTSRGDDGIGPVGSPSWANQEDYNNKRTDYYKGMGLDPNDTYLRSQFNNPMGNGDKDVVNAFYKYDKGTNTANPAYAYNEYRPHSWVGGDRDFTIAAASMIGGAALGGAGLGTIASGIGNGAAVGATMGGVSAGLQDQDVFKGAAQGGVAGGITGGVAGGVSALGSTGSTVGDAALKGAAGSGANAGVNGNSVLNGVLKGGVSGGVGSGGNTLAGGGTLGTIVGNYLGGQAAGQVGSALTGGQQGGKPMAIPNGATPPFNPNGQEQQPGQGWDFNQMVGGLGSLYQGYQGAKNINGQLDNLNSLFAPNSPYAQQLEQTLARKDAASGRRSQYGTRAVELQARLAEQAARLAPTIQQLNTQKTGNMQNTTNGAISALRNSGMLDSALKQFPSIAKYFGNQNPMGMTIDPNGMGVGPASQGYSSAQDSQDAYTGAVPSWAGSPQMDEFNMDDWYSQEGP
jgi:hypothetical protein